MRTKKILELKNRKKTYENISKYPGIHLSELVRVMNLAKGTIRYHLEYLEKRNLIIIKKEDGYTRFYVTSEISIKHTEILNIIRRATPRNIILYLLVVNCASQLEIGKEIGKDPSTIYFHIKKLLEKGIIVPVPVVDGLVCTGYKKSCYMKYNKAGREITYGLKDPYLIYDLFVVFKGNLLDHGITSNILNFFEFFFSNKGPRILNNFNSNEDKFIDILFEVFPNPYYG